jgi:hypothetical protein
MGSQHGHDLVGRRGVGLRDGLPRCDPAFVGQREPLKDLVAAHSAPPDDHEGGVASGA